MCIHANKNINMCIHAMLLFIFMYPVENSIFTE